MKWIGITLLLVFSSLSPIASAADIFEETDHLSEYSKSVQLAFARCAELPAHDGTWLVVSTFPLGEEAPYIPHAWLVDASPAEISLWMDSNRIEIACPDVERQQELRWTPNDPKFSDQWHLQNTGQTSGGLSGEDANLTGAWQSYQGTGVMIGIVDDGLDHEHPDLMTNYDTTNDYDFCGNDGNPSPSNWDAHGTAAAGVAAATGDNNVGVSGAAPDANLIGLELISCNSGDSKQADALGHENQIIDIYSNSWGPSDDGSTLEAPGPLTIAAFEDDVANGRGGLGNIITWAAGNGLDDDDDSNKDGYANARQTIAVTAITHQGDQSWYAEPGANILVAAHSDGSGEGITTTDIEGSSGYTNNDYTDNFGGTSSATPLASGVIALILEANANLTWRDVQHVLVHSSRQNDASDSSWNVNGAGHDVSHKYGFGAVDAGRAVAVAENWTNVDPAINITSNTRTINTAIPDNTPQGLNDTVAINDGLRVEHVEVIVDIDHVYRGDLIITLTSPSGTESTLAQKQSDANNNYHNWMFSTVHNWDEPSEGNWTLSVEDDGNGDTGTWNDWELIIHGVPMVLDSDGDGLTNDNETDVHGTDPYDADTDDDDLTDYEEIMVTNTDPLEEDSDNDTLLDGAEVNLYGTNPLSNDTDGDGLTDAQEILFFGSDPLTFDADTDADAWYWFQDCNDTNPLIHPGMSELLNGIDDNCNDNWDEGFNVSDSDNDDLADYPEYHVFGTNWTNPDTDGDNLTDGDEILIHGTNPLVPDPDADADGWYWFQDCNESNPLINPAMPEVLDGIDNDCDDEIDEDYAGIDSDLDGLLDLNEYNIYLTDPFDNDTDDDGLDDGIELNVTFTNPLVPDPDSDGDGFRWFVDCDDNDSAIHPNATEMWDGLDQNCNDLIDEMVNRAGQISVLPAESELELNATSDPLFLQSFVNISTDSILDIETSWFIEDSQQGTRWVITNESWMSLGPFNCKGAVSDFVAEICVQNGTTETYSVTVSISDGYEIITNTWSVTYTVWHEPELEPEPEPEPEVIPDTPSESTDDGNSTTSGGFAIDVNTRVILGLIAIVVLLGIIVLFTGRRKIPPPPVRTPPSNLPQMVGQRFR
ncbi:MAG: S8 family serine peptidase [Candidatus Thalassarchaeaceae archaeon]|nr:S8 family serine peptidase [Candidatus Thalassarchaeaceae archaeon]